MRHRWQDRESEAHRERPHIRPDRSNDHAVPASAGEGDRRIWGCCACWPVCPISHGGSDDLTVLENNGEEIQVRTGPFDLLRRAEREEIIFERRRPPEFRALHPYFQRTTPPELPAVEMVVSTQTPGDPSIQATSTPLPEFGQLFLEDLWNHYHQPPIETAFAFNTSEATSLIGVEALYVASPLSISITAILPGAYIDFQQGYSVVEEPQFQQLYDGFVPTLEQWDLAQAYVSAFEEAGGTHADHSCPNPADCHYVLPRGGGYFGRHFERRR